MNEAILTSDLVVPETGGVIVNLAHAAAYLDLLRAVRLTLLAPYTPRCLSHLRHRSVVADKESAPSLGIARILTIPWHIIIVDTLIVVEKNSWNINTIRAGHAILAVVARHGWVLLHNVSCLLQEYQFLFRKWT